MKFPKFHAYAISIGSHTWGCGRGVSPSERIIAINLICWTVGPSHYHGWPQVNDGVAGAPPAVLFVVDLTYTTNCVFANSAERLSPLLREINLLITFARIEILTLIVSRCCPSVLFNSAWPWVIVHTFKCNSYQFAVSRILR